MKRLLPLFLLCGCSLAPNYTPPPDCPPESWKQAPPADAITIPRCDPWWTLFQEENLNNYMEIALENNPTLELALQRIVEARGIAKTASAALYPSLFASLTTFNSGTVVQGLTGPVRQQIQDYTLPLDASYEVDLFGRIRNQSLAAYLHIAVTEFDYATVYLTLTTDVALSYYACRALDAQLDVLLDTIRSRQDEVDVTQARYDAGLVNYSDVTRALNVLATAKGDLEVTLQARREQEDALAALLGYYASEFTMPKDPLQVESPSIDPELTATLLLRRPDVSAAERFMAEQNALIGVARAGYFPSLTAQGALGYSSLTWGSLFDWKSRLWEWGTQTTQMLFDGGRVSGEVEAQTARFNQALNAYIQTTLDAFQEVEDALSAQVHTRAKFDYDEQAVEAAEDTRSISNERYLKGLVTYLDVVDAERTLLANRTERERSRFNTYQSSIQVIKAIGGGVIE